MNAPAQRGAANRVAATHHQTRRGLAVAMAFLAAAAIAGIARGTGAITEASWWLPLHLLLIGAVLSAIATTTQMLAITWSSSPPTTPWLAAAQRWVLAAGAVGVVVGRDVDATWLVDAGALAVIVALVALLPILVTIRRGAVTDRFLPAIDAYLAAVSLGVIGATLGWLLATDRVGGHFFEVRSTHIVINLFGLVGGVIAATLPYFSATQIRSKMSRRATPIAVRSALAVLGVAVVVAALGRLTTSGVTTAVAMIVYALALVRIVSILPVFDPSRWKWTGPRLAQLLTGVGWWVAMAVVYGLRSGGNAAASSIDTSSAVRTLAIGGFAQILVASLAYLGPVVRGGGPKPLTAGFRATRSWVSLAAGNVAAIASITEARALLLVALGVWIADCAVRAVWLVVTRERSTR